jgi:hypothetical protein
MDRSVFANCAAALLPLSAILGAGCDSPSVGTTASATRPPAVLAELEHASPGRRRMPQSKPLAATVEATGATESETAAPDFEDEAFAPPKLDALDPEESVESSESPLEAAGPMGDSTLQFANPGALGDAALELGPEISSETATVNPLEPEVLPTAPLLGGASQDAAPMATSDAAERSPLPWASTQAPSTEMAAVVRRADMRVRHGFQLAQRGALYSARSEYVAALQLIAQANDAQQSNQYFSTALATGLAALKESSDFVRQNPRKPHTDVAAIVRRHRTSILKDGPGMAQTPRAAAQRYYTYAQEQLAIAAAGETTGAMALFGLGKVAIDPAGNRGSQAIERTAQAMALYQASLLADPRNYRAANELGVLVADSGGLVRARELFVTSVSLSPQPATWRNLAVVHSRLGEKQLADAAGAQAVALERAGVTNSPAVKWVDPATFSRTVPVTDSMVPTVAAPKPPIAAAETAAREPSAPVSTAKKGISDWLPWNPRR